MQASSDWAWSWDEIGPKRKKEKSHNALRALLKELGLWVMLASVQIEINLLNPSQFSPAKGLVKIVIFICIYSRILMCKCNLYQI